MSNHRDTKLYGDMFAAICRRLNVERVEAGTIAVANLADDLYLIAKDHDAWDDWPPDNLGEDQ